MYNYITLQLIIKVSSLLHHYVTVISTILKYNLRIVSSLKDCYLMRINLEIIVSDFSADEFAVEIVVRGVDVPHAGVRICVAVRAGAEWSVWKNKSLVMY